jgi:hypothetical protein
MLLTFFAKNGIGWLIGLLIIVQPRRGQAQIRGNMPIQSDGTTFNHNIKEDGNAIRTNGERPRRTRRHNTNPDRDLMVKPNRANGSLNRPAERPITSPSPFT